VLPRPNSLSTAMLPPMSAASCAEIVSPRPVRHTCGSSKYLPARRARKIDECFSDGMPIPVIANGESKVDVIGRRGFRGAIDLDNHFAVLGELDRITDEVQKHLTQPAGVSDHGRRAHPVARADEFQPLAVGSDGKRANGNRLWPCAVRIHSWSS